MRVALHKSFFFCPLIIVSELYHEQFETCLCEIFIYFLYIGFIIIWHSIIFCMFFFSWSLLKLVYVHFKLENSFKIISYGKQALFK